MSGENNNIRDQILANARLVINPTTARQTNIDVVVFGSSGSFVAAVMLGTTPAIEGPEAATPDLATRKLLLASCELLTQYIPKLGAHQRNIHGGGVFDEDLVSAVLIEAQKLNP
ncbi:hypothetical protein LTR62_007237 [Meristemomyces frigidus]|uniref:Uncharacterized protein n=1 Tax=Meristemomyces frigidus TaxID=1508187 RepID=A0AAN7TMJ9_9PEZI|nr:hypothetical protein LTR62_007237 [Meristemomyces frigidus]